MRFSQEDLIDLTARDWHVDLNTSTVNALVKSSLSLDALATLFGLDDLYGTADLAGELTLDSTHVRFDGFTAQSEDLGYGDWSVPYASTLALRGSLVHDLTRNALSFSPLRVEMDAGTQLSVSDLSFQFSEGSTPFQITATPFALETDLMLLKGMGYLSAVEGGRGKVLSDALVLTQEGVSGTVIWDIAAAQLALTDDMAVLENLACTGNYDPGTKERGDGEIKADSALVYGIPFGAVNAALEIDADQLRCTALKTTFLAGDLALDAAVNYRDPAWTTLADLRVEGVDLAEFTKTFEPPDVVLTGIVSGTASVTLSTEKLMALNVDLSATKNLTLNRAMVREILMSQYVNDAVGSKAVQRVLEKVVGKAEQRPFDKAIVDLRLEDGMIVGFARLESKALDLTVDINAEPTALLQAIRESTDMAR